MQFLNISILNDLKKTTYGRGKLQKINTSPRGGNGSTFCGSEGKKEEPGTHAETLSRGKKKGYWAGILGKRAGSL